MWYSIACSDAKSLPLFQQFARDHPACGDDVCPVSPVAATGRGSAVRTWHRHLPRDGTVLVEPVRSAVCSGDPEASDSPSFALELALAPGRSVRADQWGDALFCGVPLIMKAKCSRFSQRNGGIAGLH